MESYEDRVQASGKQLHLWESIREFFLAQQLQRCSVVCLGTRHLASISLSFSTLGVSFPWLKIDCQQDLKLPWKLTSGHI